MSFTLLKIQPSLNEKNEVNSALFYKKKFRISINTYMSTGAQKEYSSAFPLILSIFYFYTANTQSVKFKTTILSTGIAKKEQIHKSTLTMVKTESKKFSLFNKYFQNFLFLLNIVDTNFYKTALKYFIKKNRTLKSLQFLLLNRIQNVLLLSNKSNRFEVTRSKYLITFAGSSTNYFNFSK